MVLSLKLKFPNFQSARVLVLRALYHGLATAATRNRCLVRHHDLALLLVADVDMSPGLMTATAPEQLTGEDLPLGIRTDHIHVLAHVLARLFDEAMIVYLPDEDPPAMNAEELATVDVLQDLEATLYGQVVHEPGRYPLVRGLGQDHAQHLIRLVLATHVAELAADLSAVEGEVTVEMISEIAGLGHQGTRYIISCGLSILLFDKSSM